MITPEQAEQIARTFLEEILPNKVGKTMRIIQSKNRPNNYWIDPDYNFDLPPEAGWAIRFEKSEYPGHYYLVYVNIDGLVNWGRPMQMNILDSSFKHRERT